MELIVTAGVGLVATLGIVAHVMTVIERRTRKSEVIYDQTAEQEGE